MNSGLVRGRDVHDAGSGRGILKLRRMGRGERSLGEDKAGPPAGNRSPRLGDHSVWTKEMAATDEGGHFDSTLCGYLYLYKRAMTRNTLPLSVRHLHPGIGPALMNIARLSRRIGALSFEAARRDGRIAKCRYLHIVVIGTVIFGCFRVCQRLGLAGDSPIAPRIHELVGQQRGD